ncbi:unnamed protein product [Scytosiphon promiscuus]
MAGSAGRGPLVGAAAIGRCNGPHRGRASPPEGIRRRGRGARGTPADADGRASDARRGGSRLVPHPEQRRRGQPRPRHGVRRRRRRRGASGRPQERGDPEAEQPIPERRIFGGGRHAGERSGRAGGLRAGAAGDGCPREGAGRGAGVSGDGGRNGGRVGVLAGRGGRRAEGGGVPADGEPRRGGGDVGGRAGHLRAGGGGPRGERRRHPGLVRRDGGQPAAASGLPGVPPAALRNGRRHQRRGGRDGIHGGAGSGQDHGDHGIRGGRVAELRAGGGITPSELEKLRRTANALPAPQNLRMVVREAMGRARCVGLVEEHLRLMRGKYLIGHRAPSRDVTVTMGVGIVASLRLHVDYPKVAGGAEVVALTGVGGWSAMETEQLCRRVNNLALSTLMDTMEGLEAAVASLEANKNRSEW